MRTFASAAFAAAILTSSVLCQVTIPPHASIYNGFTRGYNFTANTTFFITQLELPLDAFQAGDTAGFLVRVNSTQVLHSIGNVGPAITTSILINTGDVVDILGNWSPATPGNFTAHNSYGNSAPYATTIEGVPHSLLRTGWQWDIGDPAFAGTYLAPTSSAQIGRIFMYTSPPAGLYARFDANVTGGASPLAVNFTDASMSSAPGGVTGWAWDLDGDTIIDSTLQNPSFVYNNCGSYNVTLTVTDSQHAPSTLTKTAYITTDNVTPSFTFATIAPGVIQFTDTSTPVPTSWAWDLNGDNIVDSTVQNPVFVYPGSCTSTRVTLTASRLCRGPFSTTQNLVLSPASMTTVLTGGNGLSAVGSGNTFDIQVTNPDGISICALTMAPYTTAAIGTPLGCTIWVTDAPGGYLANHTNAAVWRQVATGTGTFAGGTFTAPIPAVMTLSNPIYIPQGTFGMAVHMTTGSGVAYTNVTAPFTYNGPDFNIIAGNGKGSPFAAAANAGRAFNGTFHYSTTTNGQSAGYGFMGAGCAGTMPIANLAHSGPPAIGTTLTVTTNNLPVSQMIMLTGFSNTTSLFGPLPFDGTPFGAPGCHLRVSTEAVLFVVGAGNQATWNFVIPNDAVFIGQKFYNQALVIDPPANALTAVASDAAAFIIGL